MQRIRLKKEYEGLIVSRVKAGVGTITFDSTRVPEEKYINFVDLFPDLFEVEQEAAQLLFPKESKPKTKKKK
jgi:hypothetical protein